MKTNAFPKLSGKGVKVALVIARFNYKVTEKLETGARQALRTAGVRPKDITAYYVPGSFELPNVADHIAVNSNTRVEDKFDAIICLGAIIRGETMHHEYLARAVTQGIMDVNLRRGIPVIFGVLTTNNLKQALARAKPDKTNKGYEAAMSAIEMINVLSRMKETTPSPP